MFGYVNILKQELKIKELDRYKSYYCGLCKTLQSKYGVSATLTLSYDITFLIVFLTSVYDCDTLKDKRICVVHPGKRKDVLVNEITEYAADMNIILTYYKLLDDWIDDRSKKAALGLRVYHKSFMKVQSRYPKKCKMISRCLKKLSYYEKKNDSNIDRVAGCFGQLMAELFVYKEDMWAEDISRTGFYLGKFIYIMDALEDMKSDKESESYNILNNNYEMFYLKHSGLNDEECDSEYFKLCEDLLSNMMAECTDAYEKLPCVEDTGIIQNILYYGVWNKFNRLKADKCQCSCNKKGDNTK